MEREHNRYKVLKTADVEKALDADERQLLESLIAKVNLHREDNGKPNLKVVVAESDWPEYEMTWQAIEARVNNVSARTILENFLRVHFPDEFNSAKLSVAVENTDR